ncbi:MAG: peptidylprolyl isomerase [Chlorobiaceae bacterium]
MKKVLMTTALLFFVVLSSLQVSAIAEVADRVVAVVGREAIFKSEIDSRVLMAHIQSPELVNNKELPRAILESMVDQQIILSKAKIDSLKIDENALDTSTNDRFRQLKARFATKEEMEARFGKSAAGIREEIRKELRNQELIETLRRKKSTGTVVTSNEVIKYYNENKERFSVIPEIVKVSQIIRYPGVSAETKAESFSQIQRVQKELQSGGDFAALARKYSQDPGSAKLGGDLGYVQKGTLIPSFEDAAYRLREGEVSDVVETRYGYHLIQMLNKEVHSVHVRHILIGFDHSKDDFFGVDQQLSIIRADVLSGKTSFAEMAKKYSDDPASARLGGTITESGSSGSYISTASLRPQLQQIISSLQKAGDISEPITVGQAQGESFHALFMLSDRIPAHKLDPEKDYAFLEDQAIKNKNRRLFSEWVSELRKEVFVRTSDI